MYNTYCMMNVQEMSLEIVCRISHYCMKVEREMFQPLKKFLPEAIAGMLNDPKIGATGILRDMRPCLTMVNNSNPHIVSMKFQKLTFSSSDCEIETSGWLDAGTECVCVTVIFSKDDEKVVRLKYSDLLKMAAKEDSLTLQVSNK